MAKISISMIDVSNQKKKIFPIGYSYITAIFGPLVPLCRLDFKYFLFMMITWLIGISMGGVGSFVSNILWGFIYNKSYIKRCVGKGFIPADDESRSWLVEHGFKFNENVKDYPHEKKMVIFPPAGAVIAATLQHNELSSKNMSDIEQQTKEQKANHYYELGQQAHAKGELTSAIMFYTKAANNGHSEAAEDLKILKNAQNRVDVPKFTSNAINVPKHPTESYQQGSIYEDEGNILGAIACYRNAADLGSIEAAEALIEMFTSGKYNINPDEDELVSWLEKLAAVNSPVGLFKLSLIYLKSTKYNHSDEYREKAKIMLEKSVAMGEPMAAYILGELYVEYNMTLALKWYKIASEAGIAAASNMIGVMIDVTYNNDFFEEFNIRRMDMDYYYEQAIRQGSTIAMVNLAMSYIVNQTNGDVGRARACQLAEQAAAAGETEGMLFASWCAAVYGNKDMNNRTVRSVRTGTVETITNNLVWIKDDMNHSLAIKYAQMAADNGEARGTRMIQYYNARRGKSASDIANHVTGIEYYGSRIDGWYGYRKKRDELSCVMPFRDTW